MNAALDGTDDFFDSRDVIERITELEAECGLTEDEQFELEALYDLREEAERGVEDWAYGETFIADHYFEEYARDLADNIGAVDPDAGWPNDFIDWGAAAEALKMDYTTFEFRGTTYWAR